MGIEILPNDARRMAKFLGLKRGQFLKQYTTVEYMDDAQREAVHYLRDHAGECVFLLNNQCQINAVKPRQCALGWPDEHFLPYLKTDKHYPCLPVSHQNPFNNKPVLR